MKPTLCLVALLTVSTLSICAQSNRLGTRPRVYARLLSLAQTHAEHGLGAFEVACLLPNRWAVSAGLGRPLPRPAHIEYDSYFSTYAAGRYSFASRQFAHRKNRPRFKLWQIGLLLMHENGDRDIGPHYQTHLLSSIFGPARINGRTQQYKVNSILSSLSYVAQRGRLVVGFQVDLGAAHSRAQSRQWGRVNQWTDAHTNDDNWAVAFQLGCHVGFQLGTSIEGNVTKPTSK